MPGGELERVLDSVFPGVKAAPRKQGLGDYDSANVSTEGRIPGTTYGSGPQPQRGGPAGQVAQALDRGINVVFQGIDLKECPPWLTPACLEVMSRMLEQTFRNFQLSSRPPSHIAPPFPAKCIDPTPVATALAGGGYAAGTFTTVSAFRVPVGKQRGVITSIGQMLESPAAFGDVEWRLLLNGTPVEPYNAIRVQIAQFAPPSSICLLHLRSDDFVQLQAASLSAAAHTAWGRLFGWHYPVRAELGNSIGSTIVD